MKHNLPVFRRQGHAVVQELCHGRSHRHIWCLAASSASSARCQRRQNERVHTSCTRQVRPYPVDQCSRLTPCSWGGTAGICHSYWRTWTSDIQQRSTDRLGHVGTHHTGQLPVTWHRWPPQL